MTTNGLTAKQIIDELAMQPHPEGGWYVETFRDSTAVAGRSVGTAIFFLLEKGQRSHWHRVDASEIWHYHAGAPLKLGIAGQVSEEAIHLLLGLDILNNERPQIVVPAGHWQSARSLGEWTLVGCTVSPGFEFSKFELAPPGWEPGRNQ
jgi:predicted cupin superfamily sugar epimerase